MRFVQMKRVKVVGLILVGLLPAENRISLEVLCREANGHDAVAPLPKNLVGEGARVYL